MINLELLGPRNLVERAAIMQFALKVTGQARNRSREQVLEWNDDAVDLSPNIWYWCKATEAYERREGNCAFHYCETTIALENLIGIITDLSRHYYLTVERSFILVRRSLTTKVMHETPMTTPVRIHTQNQDVINFSTTMKSAFMQGDQVEHMRGFNRLKPLVQSQIPENQFDVYGLILSITIYPKNIEEVESGYSDQETD